jgi:SAM-dependent methyltransferase
MGSERHASGDADELENRLTAESLAEGDPTSWFERFYRAGAAGEVELPWARTEPHRLLTRWAAEHGINGSGRSAVVVGCGQGADAEYVAGLGFDVVAFDAAETAIRLARQRYPDSAVRYQTADLLHPPSEWLHAFDLVVEIITVQALPNPHQRQAIVNVGRLAGPGGTLLAVAAVREEHERAPELGPWALSRTDIAAFGTDGLLPVRVDVVAVPGRPEDLRWLAEFRRPGRLSARRGAAARRDAAGTTRPLPITRRINRGQDRYVPELSTSSAKSAKSKLEMHRFAETSPYSRAGTRKVLPGSSAKSTASSGCSSSAIVTASARNR